MMKNNRIFDFMSVMHFIIYFFLGLFLKNRYDVALFLGILWEVFEYTVTRNKITRKLIIKHWPIPQELWDERFRNRIFDLMYNMLGYHIGNKMKFKFKK